MNLDDRVLVLLPTAKDRDRMAQLLESSSHSFALCESIKELCDEFSRGAAMALLTEEMLESDKDGCLRRVLGAQPPWSDFPLVILARERDRGHHIRESMNVALVERPIKFRSLLSVIRAALRSRKHQYEIRDLLAERKETEEALKQADRRKDEFLAILAHELRNPLAPLRNSINILQLTASNDSAITRLCETMDRQINHLVRLVDDLLEISRITRGKIELRKERVELASVARNAIETSRPLIDAAGLKLSVILPEEPMVLVGDFVRLAQVFANLLNNAAKYTNKGGRIWFSAHCENSVAVFSIRDTGIGIPPDMQDNIFDLFTQVDRATNRSQGGLGIGLTLVRNLVELHHGQVSVTSDGLGYGSEFVVRLPLSQSSLKPAPQPPTIETRVLPSKRILVVDDNIDSAATLQALLRVLGAEVNTANDGRSALAAIELYRPDVVLLDIGMPGMDGLQVAAEVRSRTEYADMTLIALTGWGQEEDRHRTREAGFDHHLVKPINIEELQAYLSSTDETVRPKH